MRIFVVAAFLICLLELEVHCSDLDQAFKEHQIVPDVIEVVPADTLKVEYPSTQKMVRMGNEIAPKDVKQVPEVTYEANPDVFYTLMLVDPDALNPKNPSNAEWQHWLVGNIPGSDLSKAEAINEYVGAAPPEDGGMHRYIFLLYKQPEKLDFSDEPHRSNRDARRTKFSAKKFAEKYKLGDPVAGNFFLAKYDESVPETYKQFEN